MVFSSAVFLLMFLPLVFVGNTLIKKEFSNYFLLLASLIFYAWGEPIPASAHFSMTFAFIFSPACAILLFSNHTRSLFMATSSIFANVHITTPEGAAKAAI